VNAGERDELIIKLKLVEMRDKRVPFFGAKIASVGFNGKEYGNLPPEFSFDSVRRDDAALISEDVANANPRSPFARAKEILAPVIKYFLFVGSGSRVSPFPADFILDYANPQNAATWKLHDPSNAVDFLWPNMVFSVRAKKGMPPNYDPSLYRGKNAASIRLWVRHIDGDFRGALHIRVRKGTQ
jgi:hypothetical protein